MLRSTGEVGQNMSSFIRGSFAEGVYLQYVAFYVNLILFFSPQCISVCKIHACKVAYHAPFHPWVYLFIENRLFYCFSHTPPICVDLITISRALKLVSCHVVCDTWWLCEISGRNPQAEVFYFDVILISMLRSMDEGWHNMSSFIHGWCISTVLAVYVNLMLFFHLNG